MIRAIFSFYFDRLTDPLGLPLDAMWEYIIIGIIGEIAFQGARSLVGSLYNDGWISGKGIGSILHWICRFIIYLVIWAITYFAIVAYGWIKANITLFAILVVGILIFFIGGYFLTKKILCLDV